MNSKLKTWHLEAAVIYALLCLAWSVEQVLAGRVDYLSAVAVVAGYLGSRGWSISDRVAEFGPDPRAKMVSCYGALAKYMNLLFLCSMIAAFRPLLDDKLPVLAITGLGLQGMYPVWRRLYRCTKRRAELLRILWALRRTLSADQYRHALVAAIRAQPARRTDVGTTWDG